MKRYKIKIDTTTAIILIFLLVLSPINIFVGISNDVELAKVLRGLVPFLFLLTYILINQLSDSQKTQLPRLLLISAISWALSIISLNFPAFVDVLRGNIPRLTYSVSNLLVPFGIVGMLLALYIDDLQKWLRWTSLVIFLLLIVASGYRSQLVLAIFIILIYYRDFLRLRSFVPIATLIAAAVAFNAFNPTYLTTIIERFNYSAGDTVRSAEREFALDVFSDNVLLGGGLGYPVPVEATRPLDALELIETNTVSYVHNFIAYILMSFGVFGAALWGALLLTPIIRRMPIFLTNRRGTMEAALLLLIVLLVYFQVSASFRQIQMWIVISSLLAIINSKKLTAPR